jgi:hypothetical protein
MPVEWMSTKKLASWRADPGWTAITIELWPHHQAVTISIEDRALDAALRRFATDFEAEHTGTDGASLRAATMTQLDTAMARFDRNRIRALTIAALWCVLNHPRDAGRLRLKMEALRVAGQAPHFTICRGRRIFGVSLGDRYADLRKDVQQRVGPGTVGTRDS